ncbi:MAPEG family protein [Octadecabacter sp. 1_MG-2023]|uniref:MAPEG family protein n=1 Tax=unclassified Octadecabacter TaxID=196158 RepID=UPI001C0A2C52|nr:MULTISPECIES: MAPEG family protein [unclassified Octadecabacter]MBU2992825.1 MAPEG family protein [Octadecabacter sp. B2R22]MDO6733724.1 MAPEG family protein [Octadecabacter sp. 1_MG-2023]
MDNFPTELGILTCLMILAASLWIPFIVGSNNDEGAVDGFTRPHDVTKMKPWVHRAFRAHLNLLEQAFPFAILVLIIDGLDGFTSLTYWTAIAFFWLRIAHAVGMITGLAKLPLRPIIFVLGYVCVLIMAYSVFAAS